MFQVWLASLLLGAAVLLAQAPTGAIAGTVTDESGATVPTARITIANRDTGATRELLSGADGSYSAAALSAGNYEVRAELARFRQLVRPAVVEIGAVTTVDLAMQVGATQDVLIVEATAAKINYDSNTIQGVVTTRQIDDLPLNGRSYLNLAQLEPGVQVTPANPAQFNAQFNVSVLGALASHTAITVDGGNVRNPSEGGSGTNFSQEVVQEFQLSSINFDLSTGITAFGAVNVVTKSGSNAFHGATYFYFRDHNIAAYPSLDRNPYVASPFFARRQGGASLGGPNPGKQAFSFFFNFGIYQPEWCLRRAAGSAIALGAQFHCCGALSWQNAYREARLPPQRQEHPICTLLPRRQHQHRSFRRRGSAVQLPFQQQLGRPRPSGLHHRSHPLPGQRSPIFLLVLVEPEQSGSVLHGLPG